MDMGQIGLELPNSPPWTVVQAFETLERLQKTTTEDVPVAHQPHCST
jgi:hypothetical protein